MSGEDDTAGKPYLLVVDDNVEWADLIEEVATRAGYRVKTAASAVAALEAIEVEAPDLVVSDIFMPEMDGIELIWELGKLPKKPALMLISGNVAPILKAAENLARENGFDVIGAFGKPMRLGNLREALEGAIKRDVGGTAA
jgi:CheY-like chemotaxis protein